MGLFGGKRPNAWRGDRQWRWHPLYQIWIGMLYRCESPSHVRFHLYGARGIKVCQRWHDLRAFIEDVEREIGPRPATHTLDRIDGDGHYAPGNIRWATRTQQAHNWRVEARKGKNTRTGAPTTSRYKGVSWSEPRQKWVAQICVNGRQRGLGRYVTEIEAARAYDAAALRLRGRFAAINRAS